MTLARVQTLFAGALLGTERQAAAQGALEPLLVSGPLPAARRLAVYQENVAGGLADALAHTFRATQALTGEAFFRHMARAFAAAHPPKKADLNAYGEEFPAFICDFAPARELIYLPETARFEWLWHESFWAENDTAADPAWLAKLTPEAVLALQLPLRASARLMAADVPVDRIWHFALSGGVEAPPRLDEGGVHLLLLRPALEVLIVPLTRGSFIALSHLSQGETVAGLAACPQLAAEGFGAAAFFAEHFSLGTFRAGAPG